MTGRPYGSNLRRWSCPAVALVPGIDEGASGASPPRNTRRAPHPAGRTSTENTNRRQLRRRKAP
jgi:hypothetical protein